MNPLRSLFSRLRPFCKTAMPRGSVPDSGAWRAAMSRGLIFGSLLSFMLLTGVAAVS